MPDLSKYLQSQCLSVYEALIIFEMEYAYNVLTDNLPGPLGKAYVTKYDASKTKQDIEEICYELIDAYRNMLAEEDWLSVETKERAVSKLNHMVVNAVYPDEWDDYSGLSPDGLTYMLLTQDSHPLHFLRVNVAMQQYDEFYDTYDVQPDDNMYLAEEDRIPVW